MRGVHVALGSERGRRPRRRLGRRRRRSAAAAAARRTATAVFRRRRRRRGNGHERRTDEPGPEPTNLVPNPVFESGGGGCGAGWTSYGAILTLSTDARSGASSCRVCAIDPDAGMSMQLTSTTMIDVKAGAMYSVEAWMRQAAGQTPTGAGGAQIYVNKTGGGQQYYQASSPTPSTAWVPSSGSFTVDADGTMTFDVHVYYPMGGCVLVDDVGVYTAN